MALSYVEPRWSRVHFEAGSSVCVEAEAEWLCHNKKAERSVAANMKFCEGWREAKDSGRIGCKSCLRLVFPAQLSFLFREAPLLIPIGLRPAKREAS